MKLCDLPTARDLKSLGYDGEYSAWIDTKDGSIEERYSYYIYDWYIPCPRIDDVAYWLREKHRIFVTADYTWYDSWQGEIRTDYDTKDVALCYTEGNYSEYEDALEGAVKLAIEEIKKRNKK